MTLWLASWIVIGVQALFQLTIGSRLAFVRTKNSTKPYETYQARPSYCRYFEDAYESGTIGSEPIRGGAIPSSSAMSYIVMPTANLALNQKVPRGKVDGTTSLDTEIIGSHPAVNWKLGLMPNHKGTT